MVLGQPRGPKTEMRMSPEEVKRVLEPADLRHTRTVELPPYHYGAIFERPRTRGLTWHEEKADGREHTTRYRVEGHKRKQPHGDGHDHGQEDDVADEWHSDKPYGESRERARC